MKIAKLHYFFLYSILIINLLQAFLTPLVDDEAYYWIWSKELSFGYFDHPPMVALWIKLGYKLFQNTLGVRILTVLLNTLVYFFWIDILKPNSRSEKITFWLLALSIIGFQVFGFITTPDACLFFFGSFYLWALYRFTSNSSWLNIIILGIAMALAMYAKYHAALLIGCTVIYYIKNRKIIWAILLGVLLFLPHLHWQYEHDFISLQYHFLHRNDHTTWKPKMVFEYLLGAVAIGSPLLIYYVSTLFFNKKNTNSNFEKSLKISAVIILIFFFIASFRTPIQAQWMLIFYMLIFPLLYKNSIALESKKWFYILSIITIVLLLCVRIYIVLPFAKTPMNELRFFVKRANEVVIGKPVFERYQKAAAFEFYAGKKAYCLSMYNHRKSQYDLWQNTIEAELEDGEITFFAMEGMSSDFILDENGDKLYYNTVLSYAIYPKIKITTKKIVKKLSLGENLEDEILIDINGYFSSENEEIFQLGIITMNEKNHPDRQILLPISIKQLGKPYVENISVEVPFEQKGVYHAYYFVTQKGMSGKLVSEKFQIEIVE